MFKKLIFLLFAGLISAPVFAEKLVCRTPHDPNYQSPDFELVATITKEDFWQQELRVLKNVTVSSAESATFETLLADEKYRPRTLILRLRNLENLTALSTA